MCIEILSHLQYVKNVIYRRSKSKVVFKWKVLSTGAPSIREGRHESLPPPPNPHTFLSAIIFFKFTYTTVNYHTFFRRGVRKDLHDFWENLFFIFLFQDFFGFIPPPPPTNTQHTFKSIARCPFQVTISILNYII